MSDLALIWDDESLAADLAIEANDLVQEGALRTACLLSLFTDRRAEEGDALPDAQVDRRGWWADAFPVVDGDRFGSRLWLLAREKLTAELLPRVEVYAREALEWLTEDRVAARVEVTASLIPRGFGLEVAVWRFGEGVPIRLRFTEVWEEAGNALLA